MVWYPCAANSKYLHFRKEIVEKYTHYFSKEVSIVNTAFFSFYFSDSSGHKIAVDIEPVDRTIDLQLIDHNNVCSTPYQEGRCARDILEILLPLFTSKLLYAILLTTLEPIIARLVYPVIQWLKRKLWKPFLFLKCCSCREEEREEGADQTNNSRSSSSVDEPDPMLVLIWYEVAFIFGCLSPLLVVLLAVQLFIDATIFEWKLRRAPSASGNAQPLPILQVILRYHLHLVLFLQGAMVFFFFFDNHLHGRYLVAAALPVVFVVSVALEKKEKQERLVTAPSDEERRASTRRSARRSSLLFEFINRMSKRRSSRRSARDTQAQEGRPDPFASTDATHIKSEALDMRERGLTINPMIPEADTGDGSDAGIHDNEHEHNAIELSEEIRPEPVASNDDSSGVDDSPPRSVSSAEE